MVAGTFTEKAEAPRLSETLGEALLPVAAIYGANASGKTNALRAIYFIVEAVVESHAGWKPERPFPFRRFMRSGEELPSEFEIDFITDGIRYRYGFRLSAVAVLEEWLHAYPNGKKQTWFHRVSDKQISFSSKMPGDTKTNKVIENLTRQNSLFLSAAAQNNHEGLRAPYRWIANLLFVMEEKRSIFRHHTAKLCESSEYFEEVSRLLSVADLGVTGMKVDSREPPDEAKTLHAKLADALKTAGLEGALKNMSDELQIQLLHQLGNESIPFAAGQESRGTLAYLALLGPVVDAIKKGRPLIVDELEASLHPLLSTHLVRLFNDPAKNPFGAQLIFNTHDTNLLESLRRDQIWFSEKANDGSTHLFPLSDFKLRRTDNLESGYLTGRYGAIPFIDTEDFSVRSEDIDAGKS